MNTTKSKRVFSLISSIFLIMCIFVNVNILQASFTNYQQKCTETDCHTNENLISKTKIQEPRDCARCHLGESGDFKESKVDLNSCSVCHSSTSIPDCNEYSDTTAFGIFKTDPYENDGVVIHVKHAGTNNRANDPNCQNCHYQVACNVCHTTITHDQHYIKNNNYVSKELNVTNGTGKYSFNFYCANSLCHNTLQNSYESESNVLVLKKESSSVIKTGNNPKGIAINPSTRRMYVANYISNTVSVIDVDSTSIAYNKVIDEIKVGKNPYSVAINTKADKNVIYITNTNDNTVTVINGNDNTIIATIKVGYKPKDIAVNETTNEVYVVNYAGDDLSVINENGEVVKVEQNLGIRLHGISIDNSRNIIYVGRFSCEDNSYNVIKISTNNEAVKVISELIQTSVSTDIKPMYGIGLDEMMERIYLGSLGGITAVNTSNGSIIEPDLLLLDIKTTVTGIKIQSEDNDISALTRDNEGYSYIYRIKREQDVWGAYSSVEVGRYSEIAEKDPAKELFYITNGTSTLVPESKPICLNCHTYNKFDTHIEANHIPNPNQALSPMCGLCHTETNLIDMHNIKNYDCYTCHAGDGYSTTVIRIYKNSAKKEEDKAGCPDCHKPNVTGSKGDPLSLANSAHYVLHEPNQIASMPCLEECHQNTYLPEIHKNMPDVCGTCHGPYTTLLVRDVIERYKKDGIKAGCNDCHIGLDHVAIHTPNESASEPCLDCHGNRVLPEIHKVDSYAKCFICHGPTARAEASVAIEKYKVTKRMGNPIKAGCNDCHENSVHSSLHEPKESSSKKCVTCHLDSVKQYLPEVHTIEEVTLKSCRRCHSSADSIVQAAIAKYVTEKIDDNKAGCQDCHVSKEQDHITLHAPDNATSQPCARCHVTNEYQFLPTIHAKSLDQNVVIDPYTKCVICHGANASEDAKEAIKAYKERGKTIKAGCKACHEGSKHVDLHIPNPEIKDNVACSLSLCHVSRFLPDEHGQRGYDCFACHESSADYVKDAILNFRQKGILAGCQDCHLANDEKTIGVYGEKGLPDTLINYGHIVLHVTDQENNKICKSCHDKENTKIYLPNIHNKENKPNLSCVLCHDENSRVLGIVTENARNHTKAECKDCHGDKFKEHIEKHSPNNTDNRSYPCTRCHLDKADITKQYLPYAHINIKKGEDLLATCGKCHDLTEGVVYNAIQKYKDMKIDKNKAGCNDCHPDKLDEHINKHDPNPRAYLNIDCKYCHTKSYNLPAEHTAHDKDCFACHEGESGELSIRGRAKDYIDWYLNELLITDRVFSNKAGCQNCHDSVSGLKGDTVEKADRLVNIEHVKLHVPNPKIYENQACVLCHTALFLPDEHGPRRIRCVTCHSSPMSVTALSDYKNYGTKAGCQDCHNNVIGTKDLPGTLINYGHIRLHKPNDDASKPCIDCHVASSSKNYLPYIHSRESDVNISCAICHSLDARPEAKDAITAYRADNTKKAGCRDCHGMAHLNAPHMTHIGMTDTRGPRFGLFDSVKVVLNPETNEYESVNIIHSCYVCHRKANATEKPKLPIIKRWQDNATSKEETTVCDNCHSPKGPYNGVFDLKTYMDGYDSAIGAKNNFKLGMESSSIYDLSETEGYILKPTKKKWCVGCHDGAQICTGRSFDTTYKGAFKNTDPKSCAGTWTDRCHTGGNFIKEPAPLPENLSANSRPDRSGVWAPNIAGDGEIYGYWVKENGGHGRESKQYPNGMSCTECHTLQFNHIDQYARTYDQDENKGVTDIWAKIPSPWVAGRAYDTGYRLNYKIKYTAKNEYKDDRFCLNCHEKIYNKTSFEYEKGTGPSMYINLHKEHMAYYGAPWTYAWDSDDQGLPTGAGRGGHPMSCPTCHNPHGTRMQAKSGYVTNPVMIRDGSLDKTTGGMYFKWYDKPAGMQGGGELVGDRFSSQSGQLLASEPSCAMTCHYSMPFYSRKMYIRINKVWTTDLSNNLKTTFKKGVDAIKIHVKFNTREPLGPLAFEADTLNTFINQGGNKKLFSSFDSNPVMLPQNNDYVYEWTWVYQMTTTNTLNVGYPNVKVTMNLLKKDGEKNAILDSAVNTIEIVIVK